MTPLLAAIDSLLGLAIFVIISAVASWLQKKKSQGENEEIPLPPRRRPEPPASRGPTPSTPQKKPVSWEVELEKLLRGEIPGSGPEPPPPVVVQAPHRPAPPPPPLPKPARTPVEFSESTYTVEKSPVSVQFKPLPTLTESAQVYAQASELDHTVGTHMREVTQHRVGSTSVKQEALSAAAASAVGMLRTPQSARAAILASIILGPPRALAPARGSINP
jgi:hypothetical protein